MADAAPACDRGGFSGGFGDRGSQEKKMAILKEQKQKHYAKFNTGQHNISQYILGFDTTIKQYLRYYNERQNHTNIKGGQGGR